MLTHPTTASFTHWSESDRVELYGLTYNRLDFTGLGTLYVTSYGWPFLPALHPEAWYSNRFFAKNGYRLPGASGTVYRLASATPRVPIKLLIKFSRLGQAVPLDVSPGMKKYVSAQTLSEARFLGPFEEFGMVEELREAFFGPAHLRIFTKRPLAIYVPAEEFDPWQTGRSAGVFDWMQTDQRAAGVDLDIRRDYILIYNWIHGWNAQECLERGLLDEVEFHTLVPRAMAELEAKGFRMLDIKPLHLILRRSERTGRLVRRYGQLAYALIDYELLERTPAYRKFLR